MPQTARPSSKCDRRSGRREGDHKALTTPNHVEWNAAILRADGARAEKPVAASVIVLSVCYLALANELRGRDFGDALLRIVETLLCGTLRADDFVARIGADEFGILLPDADESLCAKVVTRLRQAFAGSASVDGFPVSVAVGHATASETGTLTSAERWAVLRMFIDKSDQTDSGTTMPSIRLPQSSGPPQTTAPERSA